MSQTISASAYAEFLKSEYLSSFISDGGSAVKVAVVRSSTESDALTRLVLASAEQCGYVVARVDAATTRVSLVQQIFFAVAAEVDWTSAARQVVLESAATQLWIEIDETPTLESIGRLANLDPGLARREMLQALQESVYRNYVLTEDFRLAMLAYCTAELEGGGGADRARQVIGEWLRGELRLISAIRDMAIYQKIGRHNARLMIAAAAEWIRQSGKTGGVIVLDIERLAVGTKRDVGDNGLHYTLSHAMDTYEVLRQFIDATDEMSGMMILGVRPRSAVNR